RHAPVITQAVQLVEQPENRLCKHGKPAIIHGQTKLNPTPPDPVQAKLMMIMPIVFSVMFFFFPSGLVLYWLVNNIYSIVQQWVITRRIEAQSAKERQR
ncbi:MAG: hypothetical protein EBX67_11490, partial [Betaproteobacteria bacterium]|nr:hypothetical protein [Betaproteobacteria bacterium]